MILANMTKSFKKKLFSNSFYYSFVLSLYVNITFFKIKFVWNSWSFPVK